MSVLPGRNVRASRPDHATPRVRTHERPDRPYSGRVAWLASLPEDAFDRYGCLRRDVRDPQTGRWITAKGDRARFVFGGGIRRADTRHEAT